MADGSLKPQEEEDTPAQPAPPPEYPLPAHTPLPLDDPGIRWLLTGGEVNLFAVRPSDAPGGEGPRRHIGRIGAGALLCGLGIDDFGTRILAVGTAETRVTPFDPAAILDTPIGPGRLAAAVQGWVRGLGAGLARVLAPAPLADLAVSDTSGAMQPPPGTTLAARGGPVWVDLEAGEWLLLGLEPVAGLLPLPPETWLVGGGALRALPAQDAVQRPDWEAGLAAFNAACLAALPAVLALDAADELNRLKLRRLRDTEAEAESGAGFGAILGNRAPLVATAEADPLGHAFRLVAAEFGVRAKRPIRVRSTDVDAAPTLEELARASGLRLRPVRLTEGWHRQQHGPLIGRQQDTTPVALLPRGQGYRLHRLGQGAVAVDAALAATIAEDAQAPLLPLPRKVLTLMDLLGAGMQGAGRDVAGLLVCMLVAALLGQAVPLATGVAFSLLIPGGHLSQLVQLGLALGIVAGVSWMARIAADIARQRIEARAGPALHAAVWDRILRAPLATLSRQTTGETTARASATINLAMSLRMFGFVTASALATILSAGAMMLVAQPGAALIALGMLAIQIAAANIAGWLQARAFATGEALSGLADAMVFQIISGLTKLRLAGAEGRAQRVWSERFAGMRQRMTAARRIGNLYDAFAAGFAVLSTAAAFWVIALLQRVEPGQVPPSLADVMTFIAAYGLMTAAGVQIAKAMFGLWFLLPAAKFAKPLMDMLPEQDAGKVDPGRMGGAVELSNLSFRYPGADNWVFAGLTLRIEPGEFVAIVGRSGAGKSTLVRLLLGLEEPVQGAIYMDGQDLRGLDLAVLRRQVATVLQAGRVPPGTIRDAVRGLTSATDDQVWQVLAQAALARDVQAMPMQLETLLTDANRVLSGGQVQRLLLARALLQKPAILILDEATSALDNMTQAATMRAIRRVPATRIVIAHRLSTIRHADRIIVLDQGRIAEMGSFAQLIARKGGVFNRQYAEEAKWSAAAQPPA
jgi:ABC-type bacteriocin/lantibiotic exporter with double-glycine peptidase domain